MAGPDGVSTFRHAAVSFHGGVGVIGSSKILIEQEGWRVLLDIGQDFHPGQGLFRGPVRYGASRELAHRLRVGEAPWIPGLFAPQWLEGVSLPSGGDERTAVFVSHCHLDHIGLAGFVDERVPIYASPGTVRVETALARAGIGLHGREPEIRPLEEGISLTFGPFRVTRFDVDHDVVGASGYRVDTAEGSLAFTGDFRLHGRHPERSFGFADRIRGVDAFVTEGTTLGFPATIRVRTEADVDHDFERYVRETPGLVLMSLYPRNLERVEAFLDIAREAGRTIVWPEATAGFLRAYGVSGGPVVAAEDVAIDDLRAQPQSFVLQTEVSRLPDLFDLKLRPGSIYLHANGEPLGPYDPDWDLLQDWLHTLQVPFVSIGTGGHATPDALQEIVDRVGAGVLFPLHTTAPHRLLPAPGCRRLLPAYARTYGLRGELAGTPAPGSPQGTGRDRARRRGLTPTVDMRDRAILWDLDGTLYRSLAGYRFFAGILAEALPAQVRKRYLDRTEQYLAGILPEGEEPFASDWGAMVRLALPFLDGDEETLARLAQEGFRRLRPFLLDGASDIRPDPQLRRFLKAGRRHARLVVVTNSQDSEARPLLRRLALEDGFDAVIAGAGKPEGLVDAYKTVSDLEPNVPVREVLSVGDNWNNDIVPALAEGWSTAYILPLAGDPVRDQIPGLVGRTLADLLPGIARWLTEAVPVDAIQGGTNEAAPTG